jgi:glycine/D-amino acid oxidase-like deaminating enzyme
LARQLDLRTGRSVWSAYRLPAISTDQLNSDIRVDVVIVGMGISGAMAADALTDSGLAVACIDRRGPIAGSTAATTALVMYEIDQPLTLLARRIGRDNAQRAWIRSRSALMNLQARIKELSLDCRLQFRQSLYLAGDILSPDDLREEVAARCHCGVHSTYLSMADLHEQFGLVRKGAILSHEALTLDPRKLTAGLLNRAHGRGARLYSPVEAVGIVSNGGEVVVSTKAGPTIAASHAVVATGYELMKGIQGPAGHRIISTWAIATSRQKRSIWPNEVMIWEASDPYLYLRALPDGRVICGGEDEDFTDEKRRDSLIAAKSRNLSRKLKRLLPQLDATPEFAWTGSFGTTETGLPYIGAVPRRPRVFAIMGYGGNGITYSRLAAEIVCSSIIGREDRDADLFAL